MRDLKDEKSSNELEFWFELGSNYSYLTLHRIEAALDGTEIQLLWRPFLLGAIFKEQGWATSPFVLQKAKGDYVKRDMERQAEKYGLPWTWPSKFPRSTLLPMRVAILGQDTQWIGPFCRAVSRKNFVDDCEVDSTAEIHRILENLGLPADQLLAEAQSDAVKNRLRVQTAEAKKKGIFGAPTFVVNGDLFWGDDRLEDAIEWSSSNSG